MTERIQEFLRNRRSEGQDTEPCLVVDLEVVRDNYQSFAKALPDSRVFYAVKANPAPEVLSLLASMGSWYGRWKIRMKASSKPTRWISIVCWKSSCRISAR